MPTEGVSAPLPPDHENEPYPQQAEVSRHPVLQHKLALIRREKGTSKDFRTLVREITFYLGHTQLTRVASFVQDPLVLLDVPDLIAIAREESGEWVSYEATSDIITKTILLETDRLQQFPAEKINESVAVVPILRGGLGMTEALLELLPDSPVYHIGMYRNPGSNIPVQYYNRLPKGHPADVAFVLDPVIASSRTITAVVSIVKKWGARKIKVVTIVASRCGLESLCKAHPDVQVHLASVDNLAENGLDLVPGIGDPGDRLYLGEAEAEISPRSDGSPRKKSKT